MLFAVAILISLLLLNGLFAMSELAMMTSRQARLQQSANAGSKGAAAAISLSREPTRFLSTVQLGITLIGVLLGAFGEKQISGHLETQIARIPSLAPLADEVSLVVVVLAITYASLVLGELVPKRIALVAPEAVAIAISRPLALLSKIAAWPVRLLTASTDGVLRLLQIKSRTGDDVSEDDVRALVARAAAMGVFTTQEHKLFQRIFRVGDLTAGDVMVPRGDIIFIEHDTPLDDVRVLVGTSPHSHFPICDGGLDKVVGVVHIKDLISYGLLSPGAFKVTDVAHPPMFIPEATPCLRLLEKLQQSKTHIAVIVDEYGGTQGLLTLNDLLRPLVGDISRRGEEAPPGAVKRDDNSWLVDGRLPLHDLILLLGLPADAEAHLPDVSTAAGLALHVIGHLPKVAEYASWQGFRFEVVDMDGTRVDKLLIRKMI